MTPPPSKGRFRGALAPLKKLPSPFPSHKASPPQETLKERPNIPGSFRGALAPLKKLPSPFPFIRGRGKRVQTG